MIIIKADHDDDGGGSTVIIVVVGFTQSAHTLLRRGVAGRGVASPVTGQQPRADGRGAAPAFASRCGAPRCEARTCRRPQMRDAPPSARATVYFSMQGGRARLESDSTRTKRERGTSLVDFEPGTHSGMRALTSENAAA
eukprot:scaffold1146_cov399-Prasinococcus_capsulatus_cf.AAC.39